MAKDLWLNLPVSNVRQSIVFFEKLGFSFNRKYDSENSASLLVGEKGVVVMLFEKPVFKGFTGKEIPDTTTAEVLLSIGADSKEEVDEMAKKAIDAGGKSSHQPSEMNGWLYGCVFTDLDGHSWNVLHMDMSKRS
jgi:predicted lactoylglutathione lyase